MRTFFAIDDYSTLRLSVIRKLLALKLKPEEYELLPLEEDRFLYRRNNLVRLVEFARKEGGRILERYADAPRCIVVFGYDTDSGNRFDYATIINRDGGYLYRLLNPRVPGKSVHWVSSPTIQPELAENLLEVSGIS